MKIPFIEESQIAKCIKEETAFRLAKETFQLMAKKKTQMPPKIYLSFPKIDSDFRAMPASVELAGGGGAAGVKWISVFPQNRRLNLPTVVGTIVLNSAKTGMPLAVLEANTLTALRTAAAAAVATRYLANPRPKKLAIIGSGLQARYQYRALCQLYKFTEIAVWGFLPEEAKTFCHYFKNVPSPFESIADCVKGADIIVTCTPSRRPLVKKAWVKEGCHINAIGADAKGKEELDPALLLKSKVVVDEWEQASHSGEINVPVSRGLFSKRNVYAELCDVVSGKKTGRSSDKEITIFDSTGLAILDIYFASYAYRQINTTVT